MCVGECVCGVFVFGICTTIFLFLCRYICANVKDRGKCLVSWACIWILLPLFLHFALINFRQVLSHYLELCWWSESPRIPVSTRHRDKTLSTHRCFWHFTINTGNLKSAPHAQQVFLIIRPLLLSSILYNSRQTETMASEGLFYKIQ